MYGISALSFYKRGHVGRPRTKVCKLLSPELCFLDHLRGATMVCGRSLSMGLIWTSWAMTLGAVAVSRHKVQALQDASRCFKHFRSTCWTCPSFLQVRLSSSFFPLKVLTTNSRRLSLCLCQLWWTLAMSPSPPGAQRVHEHLETFGTHLRLNQYCTYTAFVHLSSRSQEFEHVWAI